MKAKKILCFILCIVLTVSLTNTWAAEQDTGCIEFYVSNTGDDNASGTASQPFKTINRAIEAVRSINKNMQQDIVVNIEKGTYYLDEPLKFTNEDSGTNGHTITYRGIDRPIISGGKSVSGFRQSTEHPGMWEADIDGVDRIMQLYVNGERRYMARTDNFVSGQKKAEKYRTAEWYSKHPNDIDGDDYNWYDENTEYSFDGIIMSKEDFGMWENPNDILFVWDQAWKTQYVPVEEIMENPDNSSQVIVRMQLGYWDSGCKLNLSRQDNYHKANRDFRIMNAMEILDSPGEFYFNRNSKKLYYIPLEGEYIENTSFVVPVIDQAVIIRGNDFDDTVKNISFEGLNIAHFAFTNRAYGFRGEQLMNTSLIGGPMSGYAVEVNFADNVNFYGNYFFGLGANGIGFNNGCYNCSFIGNAISDVDECAVIVGNYQQGNGFLKGDENGISAVPDPSVTQTDLLIDKMDYSAWYSSFEGGYSNVSDGTKSGDTFRDIFDVGDTYKDCAWISRTMDAQQGKKAWALFDFKDKYSLNEIRLYWDNSLISNDAKGNFEILLSNDRTFKDFVKVAEQIDSVQDETKSFAVNDENKYRYMMIRSIGSNVIGLSAVSAYTSDVMPSVHRARCKNIDISNNYIERIGGDVARSTGIGMCYVNGLNVTHNYLHNISYTGIALGMGWNPKENGGLTGIHCANNHLSETTKMMHDGGAIYSLSRQGKIASLNELTEDDCSIYENNYAEDTELGLNVFYTDNGTSSTIWRNNVSANGNYVYSPYAKGIQDNRYINSYAETNLWKNGNESESYCEPIKQWIPGQPNKEVYGIIKNSGLQDQYKYLTTLVPQGIYDGHPEAIYRYKKMSDAGYGTRSKRILMDNAKVMLDNGVFGEGLGMFPTSYEKELSNLLDNFTDSSSDYDALKLRRLIVNIRKNINRYSLFETMQILGKKIETARTISDNCPCINTYAMAAVYDTLGMIKQSDYDLFMERYDAVKNMYAEIENTDEEYDVLVAAEGLCNDIDDATFRADIEYVSEDGLVKYEIDKENAKAVLYFDRNTNLNNVSVSIKVSKNATFDASKMSEANLTDDVMLPIYCSLNKTYRYWTISAKYENNGEEELSNIENWYSAKTDGLPVEKTSDGRAEILQTYYSTMFSGFDEENNGASFKFIPVSNRTTKKFDIIIGASSYDKINPGNTSDLSNRFELRFTDDTVSLYGVKGGSSSLIKSMKNVNVNYGNENRFSYAITKQGLNNILEVWLNGECIFNELLTQGIYAKFFGFNTSRANIIIYQ